MSERDQVQPVPGFDPTKKQVLCTIWRPKTKSFQVILKTHPRATPTQAKETGQMSYCLDQIVDIDGCRLHFASKTTLMCHVCHYKIIQQARMMADYACQPDDLTVVTQTAGGFFQRTGPHPTKNPLVTTVPRDPSKPCPPATKDNAGGGHALDGDY
jgi:hypothetical protein